MTPKDVCALIPQVVTTWPPHGKEDFNVAEGIKIVNYGDYSVLSK